MDYAPLTPDPEHHVGASPWASSPQRTRSNFGQLGTSDIPPSPLPPQSPYASHSQGSSSAHETLTTNASTTPLPPSENGHPDPNSRHPTDSRPHPSAQEHPSQTPQQGQRTEPQRYHSHRSGLQRSLPQYKLEAKVTGLERAGRKDPVLRFDVYVRNSQALDERDIDFQQTNLPKFRTTQFRDVRRTHSEFNKLADHLISSNPEAIVPAVPPPVTSAGAGTDEDESRVKASMQRWLTYVCANEVLIRDEEMVLFVEADWGYSPVVRRKQPATGVRRKYLKQFAPPPDDTPELQEARPVVKQFYLGTMDAGQKVEKLVKARRGLGVAESELGIKFGSMNVQETHPGLANAYRKIGKVIQTVGDYHAAQGTAEATTLGDSLTYHSSDAFIVKETLTNRQILIRELLQAQSNTRSKLNAADRLKASSSVKREKVDEAISALDEARSQESYLLQKTQRVTANLVQERRRWFARTAADLRQSVREYVIREIEAERRTLATLEAVRPDIRTIDGSGGLSRLGREAHPTVRRSSLASSQGPKGDAWSGVQRRPGAVERSISGSFVAPMPEVDEERVNREGQTGRKRAVSGAGSLTSVKEDDEDRVDARNAASRLATSTF